MRIAEPLLEAYFLGALHTSSSFSFLLVCFTLMAMKRWGPL